MGIDNYSQNGTTYIPPFAYNVSTAFFGGGPTLDASQNGYASNANNNFFAINHDLNATYTKSISNNIGSVTQVGFSQQYEKMYSPSFREEAWHKLFKPLTRPVPDSILWMKEVKLLFRVLMYSRTLNTATSSSLPVLCV